MVVAPEPVPELDIGRGIAARGTLEPAPDWQRDYLARLGIAEVLRARSIDPLDQRRGGLAGLLDGVRTRAERALQAGTPPASSDLLRGFVLGQDDLIDERTTDAFKRSGLAHLLAVSGQNVVLLALLAAAALSLLGVPIRARLLTILVLIGVYVVVTGAGPSIQRAGVMGAAGIAAALADRPRSRWYVVLLAAAVTLGLDPRAAGDLGWQLSFAAVVGILLFAAPLARVFAGASPGRVRRAIAEGAALTVSATVATAPLMSFAFGTVSVVTLPANLLAVIAEAPVMWLGMLAAAVGQLPWLPVEPLTWLAGLLAAYIAQVAEWFAAPGWAQLDLGLGGVPALIGTYAALGACLCPGDLLDAPARPPAARAPRARLAGARGPRARSPCSRRSAPRRPAAPGRRRSGLTATVLDVGQGDAILLRPAGAEPILVDAGPPDADVAGELDDRGIRPARRARGHPHRQRSLRRCGGGARLDAGRPPRLRAGPSGRARRGAGRRHGARAARRRGCAPLGRPTAAGALAPGPPRGRGRAARRAQPALDRRPGALSRLPHAAHGRRRGGARAGPPGRRRRAQGRPPRQRGRRARAPCSPSRSPSWP